MMKPKDGSAGCFNFVLHAHLPYVLHHGTWPHGLEWLLEAAAETYLPLLRMVRRLSADGVALCANISFSPVLLEQLSHPDFRAELPHYLQRKISAAQEDASFFELAEEPHLLYLARHWESVFRDALDDLGAIDGDLVAAFRAAEEAGSLHLLTSAATHGYAPLLGTDESLRAQFLTAVASHEHHLGRKPEGVWLPECGYRPAGSWQFPVTPTGLDREAPADRIGVEEALQGAGLKFTFVDSHLVSGGEPLASTHGVQHARSVYHPHLIAQSRVAAFARDPRSAAQVWNAQFGYPGDFDYLDFHKKRWPGGHRYWRVTAADTDMNGKLPYNPHDAVHRSRAHAEHFADLIAKTLRDQQWNGEGAPPILCAPFDLELFGHWWHEGILFLEQVSRALARGVHGVRYMSCGEYLKAYGTAGSIRMPEGSWGAGGDHSVWLNQETVPLLRQMYAAELAVREAAQAPRWTDGAEGERIARQLCRELMLMESSDWPTLITTGAARDYAERRFAEHAESLRGLHGAWTRFMAQGKADPETVLLLRALEEQDNIFPALDPADWRSTSGGR